MQGSWVQWPCQVDGTTFHITSTLTLSAPFSNVPSALGWHVGVDVDVPSMA